jgi:ribonuclease HII
MGLILNHSGKALEAGCDEAGRGCLAGPVVAGAVILPQDFQSDLLDDSKKLNEKTRDILRPIIEKEALAWGIGIVSPREIDEINILNASFLAMHRAIDQMSQSPEYLLIDGNRFNPYKEVPYECMIKGDGRFLSIAAASILAKTERDAIMTELGEEFPEYGWGGNKGYPTPPHRKAIAAHGPTPHHRMSFQLLPSQLTLDL